MKAKRAPDSLALINEYQLSSTSNAHGLLDEIEMSCLKQMYSDHYALQETNLSSLNGDAGQAVATPSTRARWASD